MSRYWFVRHGQSVANAERWLAGHRDVGLTDAGVAEAKVLKEHLADVRPDRVITSDLQRAVATAAIAWNHRLPPARVDPRARERHLGEWEGRTIESLGAEGEALLSWDRGPPGGESHHTLAIRALTMLDGLDDGGDLLLFGHGGWIRAVVGLVDEVPRDRIGLYKVGNTEIVAREVPVGTWSQLLARLG